MNSKLLSFTLTAAMTMALLTGCSVTVDTQTAASSESAAETADEAGSEEAAAESDAETAESTVYPVSVDTYSVSSDGATWTPVTVEYSKAPEKVVCNNQGTANLLIRLGLGDRIVGVAAVYGPAPEDVADEFDKINVISTGYASKEAVLGVEPDFVCGRGDLFIDGDYGVGTVDELKEAGIDSYIIHVGETGSNFESFIADIENFGKIFDVRDKAEEQIQYYREYADSLKEKYGDAGLKMAEVSWIEDGMPVFGSAATETIQNEAFSMIGFENINGSCEGDQVSIETVIEENPQLIILFDYEGGPDMDEMIQSLYDNEALQDIDAIKNHMVISTEFSDIYSGSGDLYTATGALAEQYYGK